MADHTLLAPDRIRALRAESPKIRARDAAQALGLTEADLVAAHVGHGAIALDPRPEGVMPWIARMGDVMALTRNAACVHERIGTYEDYHPGPHAQMVLGAEIDLRIFPAHWVHGFAVQEAGAEGVKRSLQFFDAAGDAVHKVHLTPASDVAVFDRLVADLRLPVQDDRLRLMPRAAVEAARADAGRADLLRAAWGRMTDTHQFLKLLRDMRMNRLGAYRVAGAPHVRALAPAAVTLALRAAAERAIPVMIFVGNAGCIQIHGGPIRSVAPMGPWINVMDPRFNLHLRADHIAEVWCVTKPTRTGDAVSVEAFDAEGALILQIFGYRKDVDPAAWEELCASLPAPEEVMA
jgi:putative hemin transport protein